MSKVDGPLEILMGWKFKDEESMNLKEQHDKLILKIGSS